MWWRVMFLLFSCVQCSPLQRISLVCCVSEDNFRTGVWLGQSQKMFSNLGVLISLPLWLTSFWEQWGFSDFLCYSFFTCFHTTVISCAKAVHGVGVFGALPVSSSLMEIEERLMSIFGFGQKLHSSASVWESLLESPGYCQVSLLMSPVSLNFC